MNGASHSLYSIVQQEFSLNPFGSTLFFFAGDTRRPDQGAVLEGNDLRYCISRAGAAGGWSDEGVVHFASQAI